MEFGDDGSCGVGRFGKARAVDFASPRAVHGYVRIAHAPDIGVDAAEGQGLIDPGFEVGPGVAGSGFVYALAVVVVDDAAHGQYPGFQVIVRTRKIKLMRPRGGIPT